MNRSLPYSAPEALQRSPHRAVRAGLYSAAGLLYEMVGDKALNRNAARVAEARPYTGVADSLGLAGAPPVP
ncbi:MAG: hypothetical protein EXR69_09620 [Myxococcales bacterium]|nr:hypothetical protein [Myxococcales bacterium]